MTAFSETPAGSGAGDAHAGSGSGTVGVGAEGQNSAVGVGVVRTKPVGSASVRLPSKTDVPAGMVTA